jgi:hypothetical protein
VCVCARATPPPRQFLATTRRRWRATGSARAPNGCTWSTSTARSVQRRPISTRCTVALTISASSILGNSAALTPEQELEHDLPINLRRLREIRRAVTTPIQFGGGLRTLDDIQLALELGADRVVLGTVAIDNPGLVSDALLRWGAERIVVGIDAREGKVATHGWQSTSSVDAIELGHRMQALGVTRVVYTDISRDGMLSGVNIDMTLHDGRRDRPQGDRQRRRGWHRRHRGAEGARALQYRRRDRRAGDLHRRA